MDTTTGRMDCYGIKLRRAAGNVTEFYDRMLQPVGLTLNQFSLLGSINKLGVCSIVQLSKNVGLEKSTLVRTLKPLLAAGYIEDTSIKGSRNRQLKLTKQGLLAIYRGNIIWQDAQAHITKDMGAENMQLLMGMLEALCAIK